MSESSKDTGIISTLLERLEKHRLPKALALKEKVDQGERLSDFDIEHLEKMISDAKQVRSLIDRHPEYQSLAAHVIHLYKEIMDKAMENEEKS